MYKRINVSENWSRAVRLIALEDDARARARRGPDRDREGCCGADSTDHHEAGCQYGDDSNTSFGPGCEPGDRNDRSDRRPGDRVLSPPRPPMPLSLPSRTRRSIPLRGRRLTRFRESSRSSRFPAATIRRRSPPQPRVIQFPRRFGHGSRSSAASSQSPGRTQEVAADMSNMIETGQGARG